jgi:hypothetical protein
MIFKDDKTYKILKYLFSIALPAISVFYVALSDLWTGVFDLPYPAQISGTIGAIVVLGNTLIGVGSEKYDAMRKNGEIAEEKTYRTK